jgi:type II secretory pathway pseudopilin PulG
MKPRLGFTMLDIMVVASIIGVLAALIFPVLINARNSAKQIQCTNNLQQLGKALIMYSNDNINLGGEVYPAFLTGCPNGCPSQNAPQLYSSTGNPLKCSYSGLFSGIGQNNYVADLRIFICPMDYTKATIDGISGQPSLKPYYNATTPFDNKATWAERTSLGFTGNCSYLYEFSGRTCEGYVGAANNPDSWSGSPTNFASSYLIAWDDSKDPPYAFTNPDDMDQTGSGVVTWQQAKFWQLNNGDVFISGCAVPGNDGVPVDWTSGPYNWAQTHAPQQCYTRTWIPIIRCFWHCTPALVDTADHNNQGPTQVLNLALDNNVFLSVPGWEQTSWTMGHVNPR